MSTAPPKVTVVIPTYNRPDLVMRALSSVCRQTFTDFEVLVIDDGQKERAEAAVASIGDSRIRYVANEHSLGGGGARNVGISMARGEFVAFLDDDDEWFPEKLQIQVDLLEKYPEAAVAFSGLEMCDVSGEVIRTVAPNEEGIVRPFERLLRRPYIWTSVILMRLSLCDEEGFFDIHLTKNQEWDVTLRLSRLHPFVATNRPLARLHVLDEESHMGGKGNMANIIKGNELFLKKYHAEYALRPKVYAVQLFRIADFYYQDQQFIKMRSALRGAFSRDVFNVVYLSHFLVSLCGSRVYGFLKK